MTLGCIVEDGLNSGLAQGTWTYRESELYLDLWFWAAKLRVPPKPWQALLVCREPGVQQYGWARPASPH